MKPKVSGKRGNRVPKPKIANGGTKVRLGTTGPKRRGSPA